MYFRASLLKCKIKTLKNWFNYRRKNIQKPREKSVKKTNCQISKEDCKIYENMTSSTFESQKQENSSYGVRCKTFENGGSPCFQNMTYSYGWLFIPVNMQANPCLGNSFYHFVPRISNFYS